MALSKLQRTPNCHNRDSCTLSLATELLFVLLKILLVIYNEFEVRLNYIMDFLTKVEITLHFSVIISIITDYLIYSCAVIKPVATNTSICRVGFWSNVGAHAGADDYLLHACGLGAAPLPRPV